LFERFTERNRQIVAYAQEESRSLRHNYIGTEHLLLGVLLEKEGLAARVLGSLDIEFDDVKQAIIKIVGEGDVKSKPEDQIPFTPSSKKVLELSLRESLALGHNYIGTEHTLLGIVRENDGVTMRILHELGVDAEQIRNETIRLLAGASSTSQARGSQKVKAIKTKPPRASQEEADKLFYAQGEELVNLLTKILTQLEAHTELLGAIEAGR